MAKQFNLDQWVSLEEVPSFFLQTLLTAEDASFFIHRGFNLSEVFSSLYDWSTGEKDLRGASTITQQLMKNVFLSGEKTFFRKINELFMAIIMENFHSKVDVLESYLNIADFGPNKMKLTKASQIAFNKNPNELTRRESLFLISLLPHPHNLQKMISSGKIDRGLLKRMKKNLRNIVIGRKLTFEEGNLIINQTFDWERRKTILFLDKI